MTRDGSSLTFEKQQYTYFMFAHQISNDKVEMLDY